MAGETRHETGPEPDPEKLNLAAKTPPQGLGMSTLPHLF
jgi:hypothetical protein